MSPTARNTMVFSAVISVLVIIGGVIFAAKSAGNWTYLLVGIGAVVLLLLVGWRFDRLRRG